MAEKVMFQNGVGKMNKCYSIVEKGILLLLCMIYVFILGINLFCQNIEYSCKKQFLLSNIVLVIIVIGIVILVSFMRVWKKLKEQVFVNYDKIVRIGSILLFVLQLFICYHIFFATGWDSESVTYNTELVSQGNTTDLWNWYYSYYPNNTLITFVYSVIFNIA